MTLREQIDAAIAEAQPEADLDTPAIEAWLNVLTDEVAAISERVGSVRSDFNRLNRGPMGG